MAIDRVAHSCPSCRGGYIQTRVMTDMARQTGCARLLFREQSLRGEVMMFAVADLPFPLLGFRHDNDSVLVNETISSSCDAARFMFTRSRSCRKDGEAHVEQKNGAVVRRTIGCRRYEGQKHVLVRGRRQRSLQLFVSFCQTLFKRLKISCEVASARKHDDPPMTPDQRLSGNPRVCRISRRGWARATPSALSSSLLLTFALAEPRS
jgi:hypothetical protein